MRRCLAVLSAVTTSVAAANAVEEEYPLAPTEKVRLEHPVQINHDVTKAPDDGFRAALRLRAFDASGTSRMSFKIFPGGPAGTVLAGQKEVDLAVSKLSERYVQGSVEKTNAVQPNHTLQMVHTKLKQSGTPSQGRDGFESLRLGCVNRHPSVSSAPSAASALRFSHRN
jgi:hypothetical protein